MNCDQVIVTFEPLSSAFESLRRLLPDRPFSSSRLNSSAPTDSITGGQGGSRFCAASARNNALTTAKPQAIGKARDRNSYKDIDSSRSIRHLPIGPPSSVPWPHPLQIRRHGTNIDLSEKTVTNLTIQTRIEIASDLITRGKPEYRERLADQMASNSKLINARADLLDNLYEWLCFRDIDKEGSPQHTRIFDTYYRLNSRTDSEGVLLQDLNRQLSGNIILKNMERSRIWRYAWLYNNPEVRQLQRKMVERKCPLAISEASQRIRFGWIRDVEFELSLRHLTAMETAEQYDLEVDDINGDSGGMSDSLLERAAVASGKVAEILHMIDVEDIAEYFIGIHK